MINGINHVALATPDLDRMVEFYSRVLGFEVCMRSDWSRSELIDTIIGVPNSAARQTMLRCGNVYLEIFQYLEPKTAADAPLRQPYHQGYTHLCLDVSNIDLEYARLTEAGFRFTRAPPHLEGTGLRAVYGRDPDGNIVEIQETLTGQMGVSLDQLPLLRREPAEASSDYEEIRRKLALYCRAIDRMDEPLLRSLFHPDARHKHGAFEGPSSQFCGFAMALVAELDGTSHHLSNIVIEFDRGVAHTEAYFLAVHRMGQGKTITGPFSGHDTSIDEICTIGGRYIDRWEKRLGVWKIARRTGVHDWESWQPAHAKYLPVMAPDQKGARNTTDPAYRRD